MLKTDLLFCEVFPQLRIAVAIVRGLAANERVQENPKAPDVSLQSILLLFHHLRCHPVHRPLHVGQHLTVLKNLCVAKVSKHEFSIFPATSLVNENVHHFDVSVVDSEFVQFKNCIRDLFEN